MNIVDRVKNILITPKTEWDVIAAESTPPAALTTGYVLLLALIPAVCGLIGTSIIGGFFGVRMSILWGISSAVMQLVFAVVGVFILAFIIDLLAPTFGGQKNFAQAFKVAAYSYTPGWVAGVFLILPLIGWLAQLLGLYGIFLLYLGLPKLMKSPEDKAVPYTVVVIVAAIVVSVVLFALTSGVGLLFGGAALLTGAAGRSAPSVTFDKDSNLGKLEDFSKKMEAAGKKMEAAQKSGDASQQAAAAMEALGSALTGGVKIDPIGIEELKPFIPETFAGLPKTSSRAEKSGIASLMVSKAEAVYSDAGGKRVALEITDTGGASGLVSLAGWAGVMGEKEDDSHLERTRKEGDRIVHESVSKRGGANKYGVILASRYVVSASGSGVDLGTLKSGVNGLDLRKLESMKNAGVTK
ncbi:MAG: Yip1 family protein [Pseudomonadota bacterium]